MERGTDGSAGIAGGRLDVEAVEWCLGPDPPVRHSVQRDATRETDVVATGATGERRDQMEVDLFETGLECSRHVIVHVGELGARSAGRPKGILHARREDAPD